jgi:SOS-response transcriptional repressor LexA
MKYYWKKGNEITLEPANSAYPNIVAREELQIFGIVTGIVRKLKY